MNPRWVQSKERRSKLVSDMELRAKEERDRWTQVALSEYNQVIQQFRVLTDIRFKLLTYLPLGTITAAYVSAGSKVAGNWAIDAFAFVATLCIAVYNKRNDQHYNELVARAAELERTDLAIVHGSFANRPTSWLRYGTIAVEHGWPIGLLYVASASLWASLLSRAVAIHLGFSSDVRHVAEIVVPALVVFGWRILREQENASSRRLGFAVRSLRPAFGIDEMLQAETRESIIHAIVEQQSVFRVQEEAVRRRVICHWPAYERDHDESAASELLAAVVDLPARWIEDLWSGRR